MIRTTTVTTLLLLLLASLAAAAPSTLRVASRLSKSLPVDLHSHSCGSEPADELGPRVSRLEVEIKGGAVEAVVEVADGGLLTVRPDAPATVLSTGGAWPASASFPVAVRGAPGVAYELLARCAHDKVPRPLSSNSRRRAAVATTVTSLSLGTPVDGSATSADGGAAMYKVSGVSGCNVSIELAGLQGDPDLYVSASPDPSADNYNWSSNNWGDDAVYVPSSPADTLYVGVISYSPSSQFTLVADATCAHHDVTPVSLSNGMPSGGSGEMLFEYETSGASPGRVKFELSPETGDPDIFVSVNSVPTASEHQWAARAYGADTLVIESGDPHHCSGSPCKYYALVVPFGSDPELCVYSITASSGGQTTELQAGVPVEGEQPNGTFAYYKLAASASATQDLTVSVAARVGDPDVFVSTSEERPGRDAEWHSRRIGSDAVTVMHGEPHTCHDCFYYVSVECYGYEPCSFTVTAEWNEPVILEDGTAATGSLPTGAQASFLQVVDTSESRDVTFSLTELSGECNLFVKVGEAATPTAFDNASYWYESFQDVTMHLPEHCNSDHPQMTQCAVYASVQAASNCSYSLVATAGTERSEVELLDGVPYEAENEAGTWAYFSFENGGWDDTTMVRFRVTSDSGDADIYVTAPPDAARPSSEEYDFMSNDYGDDVVEVDNPEVGVYRVGVYGFTSVAYAIVAESSSSVTPSYVVLEDGVAQTVDVPANGYSYFLVSLWTSENDFQFTSSCEYGSVALYMQSTDSGFPTYSQYQWSGIDGIQLRANAFSSGQYYVGLYGYEDAYCQVVATSVSGAEIVELEESVPSRGRMAGSGEAHYYRYFHSGRAASAVTITLTPLQGDTDLFISTTEHYPSQANHTWASTGISTEVVTIDSSDPHYVAGADYFVAAVSFGSNTSYSVVVSEDDVVYLASEEPQRGEVSLHHYAHFVFFTLPTNSRVTLHLETVSGSSHVGHADLFASVGDGNFPTSSDYRWHAAMQNGHATLSITDSDSGACNSYYCRFAISVYGVEATNFMLTATSS